MSNTLIIFHSKFQHLDLRTAILQSPSTSSLPPRFLSVKPAAHFAFSSSSSLTSTSLPPSCFTSTTKVPNCSYAAAADCSCDGPNGIDDQKTGDDGGTGFLDGCQIVRDSDKIDEDLQRHNELIEIIKGKPSDISEIVAGCRKDFTKEFFVHLHTVAETYNDNPKAQNGHTYGVFVLFTQSLTQ